MISIDLSGRVALVTGSSRGIGRATALLLAQAGADIVINYRENGQAGQLTANMVRDIGREVLLVQCDVTSNQQVNDMVQQALTRWGHIDILVSNAGAGSRSPITEITDEEYDRVFDTNAKGFMRVARAALPGMKDQQWGKVVAISSVVGKTGKAFLGKSPVYASAKAALVGMVRGMARECAPYSINVNCVRPGWIDTDATARASETLRQDAIQQIPLGRTGKPRDIAGAVLFLVSEYSSYMTGAALDVNGGLFIG